MERLLASSLLLPHQMNNPNLPKEHSTFNYNRRLKEFQKVNLKTFKPQIGSTVSGSSVFGGFSDGDGGDSINIIYDEHVSDDDDGNTSRALTEEEILDQKISTFLGQSEQGSVQTPTQKAVETFEYIEPATEMNPQKDYEWVKKEKQWNATVYLLREKFDLFGTKYDKTTEFQKDEIKRLVAMYNKVNQLGREKFKNSREKDLIVHFISNYNRL